MTVYCTLLYTFIVINRCWSPIIKCCFHVCYLKTILNEVSFVGWWGVLRWMVGCPEVDDGVSWGEWWGMLGWTMWDIWWWMRPGGLSWDGCPIVEERQSYGGFYGVVGSSMVDRGGIREVLVDDWGWSNFCVGEFNFSLKCFVFLSLCCEYMFRCWNQDQLLLRMGTSELFNEIWIMVHL